MAHFGDMLAAEWMRIWAPRGRFMVTKTANVKFKATQAVNPVKFKMTDTNEIKFREERRHGA